jgi:hypothetical protein
MKTKGVNGWSYYTYNNAITYREMVWDEEKECWNAYNDGEIIVAPKIQTSKNHTGTVRRWTCPADGKYIVKYNFGQQVSKRNSDKERLSHFILRRNHKVLEKYVYNRENQSLIGNYEIELNLETGEALNFEFYNGSEHTTETLEVNISIEKHCE